MYTRMLKKQRNKTQNFIFSDKIFNVVHRRYLFLMICQMFMGDTHV